MKEGTIMTTKTRETVLEEHGSERTRCEVYSRIVGYLRPVSQWNPGKQEEFKDRVTYDGTREGFSD